MELRVTVKRIATVVGGSAQQVWLTKGSKLALGITSRLSSLLSPFISGYSTNIKRFAEKLATFERRVEVARRRVRRPVSWTICLREFLTETSESLDTVDNQLVRFEQEPNNAKILDNIFRLVHTIKGTCGFLGLPRLEALAHAAETLMGKFRDGMPVTGEAVTLILTTIDRIKDILGQLEATEAEPEGDDRT